MVTAAEASADLKITTEATRATAAEGSLGTDHNVEVTGARAAEAQLSKAARSALFSGPSNLQLVFEGALRHPAECGWGCSKTCVTLTRTRWFRRGGEDILVSSRSLEVMRRASRAAVRVLRCHVLVARKVFVGL